LLWLPSTMLMSFIWLAYRLFFQMTLYLRVECQFSFCNEHSFVTSWKKHVPILLLNLRYMLFFVLLVYLSSNVYFSKNWVLLCLLILWDRNIGSHPIEFDSLVGKKFMCKSFDVVAKRKGNKRCKQVKFEKEGICIRLFVIVPFILLYVILVVASYLCSVIFFIISSKWWWFEQLHVVLLFTSVCIVVHQCVVLTYVVYCIFF
jgi:hypothetical protein